MVGFHTDVSRMIMEEMGDDPGEVMSLIDQIAEEVADESPRDMVLAGFVLGIIHMKAKYDGQYQD